MGPAKKFKLGSATDFVTSVLDPELSDLGQFDADVVGLVRKHLGASTIHSKAGARLAEDLVKLAKARASEKP